MMETTKALLLLSKLNGNKERVMEIAKSYVADMLSAYHNVEEYALMKDGTVTPFANIDEFANLRANVAKIEAATNVIDEFFMIEDDIAKLREYSNMGMLVYYEEPEPEEPVTEVSNSESASEAPVVTPIEEEPKPAKESAPAEKPAPKPMFGERPTMNFSTMNFNTHTEKAKAEVKEAKEVKEVKETKEEAPVESTPKVGITKIDVEDKVKAMVGYAEGSNYENPYETVYEDDVVTEDQVPTAIRMFDGSLPTTPDAILAEGKMVLDEGKNYIYTGCNPNAYLNKRMEYYRIKYATKNIDDGGDPEPEIEIIKGALEKIRDYEARNTLISIQLVEYDMALVEKVYGLLKEFDDKLYPPEALPNIDRIRELMNSLSDYDEKASLLTKFYKFDVLNFLKTVYNTCKNLELDKNKRFEAESKKLEDKFFEEMQALNREQYAQKQGLKGLLGGNSKAITTKKKELESRMEQEQEELKKEITEIVERDTKMVGKNMKLYARIDNILKNNVLCFKSK